MKTYSFFLVIALAFTQILSAQNIGQQFFDDVDRLLKTHVEDGLVDYTTLSNNPIELQKLVKTIAQADISSLDFNTKQASLINAYNLNVINKVVNS